jgi:DNA-binding response OmpR family regulator
VHPAVALVSEADWALRQLIQGALGEAGFETLDSASFVEFDLKLRSRRFRQAPHALLVLADVMSSRWQPALESLGALRVESGLSQPHVVLTREFGVPTREALPELGGCTVAAVLEKPFDFGLLQAIAIRCRTSGCTALGGAA